MILRINGSDWLGYALYTMLWLTSIYALCRIACTSFPLYCSTHRMANKRSRVGRSARATLRYLPHNVQGVAAKICDDLVCCHLRHNFLRDAVPICWGGNTRRWPWKADKKRSDTKHPTATRKYSSARGQTQRYGDGEGTERGRTLLCQSSWRCCQDACHVQLMVLFCVRFRTMMNIRAPKQHPYAVRFKVNRVSCNQQPIL